LVTRNARRRRRDQVAPGRKGLSAGRGGEKKTLIAVAEVSIKRGEQS